MRISGGARRVGAEKRNRRIDISRIWRGVPAGLIDRRILTGLERALTNVQSPTLTGTHYGQLAVWVYRNLGLTRHDRAKCLVNSRERVTGIEPAWPAWKVVVGVRRSARSGGGVCS